MNIGFDIIIPTYRPGEKFTRLLSLLQQQEYPYRQLIVINTEEELMAPEIKEALKASRDTRLVHISRQEFDHAATRRLGVSMSDAEAFICMTDDAVPADTHLLEELAKVLEEEGSAVAYARQLPNEEAGPAERITRSFNYPPESRRKTSADLPELGIKTFFASNVCCAYRRAIYDSLGGFCEKAIFNEDMIYAHKAVMAGYAVCYCAEAKVYHSHQYTPLQQFHRNFDLGVSQAMHPEVFGGFPSEGEGLRLVRRVRAELKEQGEGKYFPGFFISSAFRYLGYRLGKAYRRLPKSLVRQFSQNKTFVENL